VTVRASLDGFAPWSQRFYVRGLDAQLTAALVPAGDEGSHSTRSRRRSSPPEL